MLTQRKALVLVTLVLLGCALLSTRWTRWLAMPITHTVNALQYPADRMASAMKTDPEVAYPEQSDDVLAELLARERKENEALWIEIDRLNEQLASFNAIINVRDIDSIRLVDANVSRYNNDPVNPTMLVMRGSLHGLKADDAVAYKSNLIGFVTDSVGPATATVTLVTRKGFSIGVHIKPPPDPNNPDKKLAAGWPFKTRVKSDGAGRFFVTVAKSTAKSLRPGDYVRAADTIRESANGFLLGLIEKIEDDPKDPLNLSRVVIKPRAPIGPQSTVTILTERTD
jgi:cell shape-determining protein MreC